MLTTSPRIQEALRVEVRKMLEEGVVEPSASPLATPVVMHKKPDATLRFCMDYRDVNGATSKDGYPLPRMDAILEPLRGAKYISNIDLSHAYHQISLDPASKEITAFMVPGMGFYQFTRMPYDLCNPPATFQRLLDKVVGPELDPHAFSYLDDIVVISTTFEGASEVVEGCPRQDLRGRIGY